MWWIGSSDFEYWDVTVVMFVWLNWPVYFRMMEKKAQKGTLKRTPVISQGKTIEKGKVIQIFTLLKQALHLGIKSILVLWYDLSSVALHCCRVYLSAERKLVILQIGFISDKTTVQHSCSTLHHFCPQMIFDNLIVYSAFEMTNLWQD